MTSTPKDVNSKHSNNVLLGKRKKVREKRSNYLQKWLEKSMQCTLDSIPDIDPNETNNTMNANYWNAHTPGMYGQRLFNATSDPSVFRYAPPFPYSQEPMSLPLFQSPAYPPIPTLFPNYPQPTFPQPIKSTPKRHQYVSNRKKQNNKKQQENESDSGILQNGTTKSRSNASSVVGTNNDFASLPPGINNFPDPSSNAYQDDSCSGNKRRFSDPGIVQNLEASNDESQDESDGDSSLLDESQTDGKLVMYLVDQITSLRETNRKLYKELHNTRAELDTLKQQSSMWRSESLPRQSPQSSHFGIPSGGGLANSSTMYTPGMLADLVREIRDAAKVREEALYSRVKTLLEERHSANKINGNILDKNLPDWRHLEQNYKYQGHMNGMEKSKHHDIINRLEEDLQRLRFQQSREEASNSLPYSNSYTSPMNMSHQHNSDLDRARLRADLSKERAAREAADAHVHKLELMVTQLSKRAGHHSNSHTPTHNSSSMVASPSDGLHMVLGPVTDL